MFSAFQLSSSFCQLGREREREMHLFLEKCCGLALRFQHQLMLLFRLLYRQRSKADVSPDSELQNVTDMTDIKILAGWGKSLGEHVFCWVKSVLFNFVLKLSRFMRCSSGKNLSDDFAPCKRIDTLQLCRRLSGFGFRMASTKCKYNWKRSAPRVLWLHSIVVWTDRKFTHKDIFFYDQTDARVGWDEGWVRWWWLGVS